MFARAKLFSDRVELRGFGLGGPYHQVISLDDVCNVEWFTAVKGEPNLRLTVEKGAEHFLWVEQAGTWCYEIRSIAGIGSGSAALPSSRRRIADAA